MTPVSSMDGKTDERAGETPDREVESVVEALKNIVDPETGINLVDEGLLYGITVEGSKVQVFLRFTSTTPACNFCKILAINVQRRITRDVVRILREDGFGRVEVYDEFGLLLDEG